MYYDLVSRLEEEAAHMVGPDSEYQQQSADGDDISNQASHCQYTLHVKNKTVCHAVISKYRRFGRSTR